MNFRFTKSRSLISRYYTPRGLYRNSGRYWDYALYPFWDEMNVGIAQGAVQSFVRTPENSSPFSSCNRELNIETTPRTLRLTTPSSSPSSSTVNVHWLETPTSHIFRADVPGLRREDLSILVEGSTLQISGHRNLDRIPTDVNEQIQWEVSFVRRFRLPTTAVMEQISAMLDHGVLTLTIPKLPIPPSVSWFVPISGCPSQVIIRNWNPQEQTQPDSHGSDHGSNSTSMVLGRSRIESERTQECNYPSSISVHNISLKDDTPSSSTSAINIPIDPKLTSKTLNVTQEEGTGPNAKVTLNININTGKVSAEGESSSAQITPTSQMEDQKFLPDGSPRPSSRSRSISPPLSNLKPRSSLAQPQDYQADEVDLPPSTSRGKSSIHIDDDQEIDPPASISRRKSSVQIDDDQEIDPLPSTSRRKSSIQKEDDQDNDPYPPSSRRKSSIQMDKDEDVDPPRDPPSSKRQSIMQNDDFEEDDFGPPPSALKRKSSIKKDDPRAPELVENMDKRLSLGRQKTKQFTKRGSQRQPSVVANNDGDDGDEGKRTSNAEDFVSNEKQRSSKRGSAVVENEEGADERGSTSKREDSRINERRRSSKRDSSIVQRQPSIVEDDEDEDTSDVDDYTFNKRKGSTKDRSKSQERRESRRESSPGSVRRKSSSAKRGSVAKAEGGRRESTDNFSRRRESSLGLGADLAASSTFDAREDEEET